jgi:hypothetical protein
MRSAGVLGVVDGDSAILEVCAGDYMLAIVFLRVLMELRLLSDYACPFKEISGGSRRMKSKWRDCERQNGV